ncbi:hypothetical protein [Thermocrinis sp.]|uniref:hypothetical protein n=1 Tax=Thermocrinis sp. TaxID=2024383 RepID=UPI002FDCA109
MDRREEALRLSEEIVKKLLEFGTELDEYYRKIREIRIMEDSLSFQSALINVEHAFFMVVQSLNVLREQLNLLKIAAQKGEVF